MYDKLRPHILRHFDHTSILKQLIKIYHPPYLPGLATYDFRLFHIKKCSTPH